MTGAGLKKCSPSTRSGRDVTAAMSATDSALVLVARRVAGAAASSSARKIACFAARSSSAASMTSSASAATSSSAGVSIEATEASVDPCLGRIRVEVEPAGAPLEARPDALATALDRGRVHVVEVDPMAGLDGQLRDPGTHRAGPDDADGAGQRSRQTGLIASNGWRQSRQ